jgi:hypothetical protein
VYPGTVAIPDLVLQLGSADPTAVARALKALLLLTGAGAAAGVGLALGAGAAASSGEGARVLSESLHAHDWLDKVALGRYPAASVTLPVPAKERAEAGALLDRVAKAADR